MWYYCDSDRCKLVFNTHHRMCEYHVRHPRQVPWNSSGYHGMARAAVKSTANRILRSKRAVAKSFRSSTSARVRRPHASPHAVAGDGEP
mmetsp:Transcript_14863/g.36476  ORF Transcript_14863/g.36476 Transcript_14863/m.36476 type:complete len:89 (+) Transcript_14863:62-328(+)